MRFPLPFQLSKVQFVLFLALLSLISHAAAEENTLSPGNYVLVYQAENAQMSTLVVTIKAEPNSSLSIACEKGVAGPSNIFQKSNVFSFTLLFTGQFTDPATAGGWVSSMTFLGTLSRDATNETHHGVFAEVNANFPMNVNGSKKGEFLLYRLPASH